MWHEKKKKTLKFTGAFGTQSLKTMTKANLAKEQTF